MIKKINKLEKLPIKDKFNKGFTLVEILVYMALMSIFLMVLLDVFTITLNTKLTSESNSTVIQDSRYILSKLLYDINNADSITSPVLGATDSSLQIVSGGVTNVYMLINGNLVKIDSGISMNLNSVDTQLDSISFKNIGNVDGKPTIQVVYTVRSKIIVQGRETQILTINTTAGTR